MEIDYEKLRDDLFKYFENALTTEPEALVKMIRVDGAENDELLAIAKKNNFDINNYVMIGYKKRK